MLAKHKIEKQVAVNKKAYDDKHKNKPVKYKVGDFVRIKLPQTKVGLKKKLRNDLK